MRYFTLLALIVLASPLRAEDPSLGYPVPSTFPTPDGKHIFVFVPPPLDMTKKENEKRRENSVHREIREKYTAGSGLYSVNDASKPLWSVDWYSYEVYPCNDAVSLVRVHGDNMLYRHFPARRLPEDVVAEQVAQPGISFYREGKLLRTYSVRELVKDPDELPHMMQRILWMAGGILTVDNKKFVLMTQDSRQLVFELETGKMLDNRAAGISNETRMLVIRLTMGVVGFAGFIVVGLYFYLKRKEGL